jgi:Neprosin
MTGLVFCNRKLIGSVLHVRRRKAPEQFRKFDLRDSALGDPDHRIEQQPVGIIDVPSVQTEEDKRRVERRPLVPVDKCLALRKVVRIRRGHDEHIQPSRARHKIARRRVLLVAQLLAGIRSNADLMMWGGEVYDFTGSLHTTIDMGDGTFPTSTAAAWQHSSYQRTLRQWTSATTWAEADPSTTIVTNTTCYDLLKSYSSSWKNHIYFGGKDITRAIVLFSRSRHLTRWLRVCAATLAVLVAACGDDHGPSVEAGTMGDSGQTRTEDSGSLAPECMDFRLRICCGRAGEMPGLSCLDLTKDGGEFGLYGRCLEENETLEGKVIGAQCCAGLTRTSLTAVSSGGDCTPAGPPSVFRCLRCGDGVCGTMENRCTCPGDCAGLEQDAGEE